MLLISMTKSYFFSKTCQSEIFPPPDCNGYCYWGSNADGSDNLGWLCLATPQRCSIPLCVKLGIITYVLHSVLSTWYWWWWLSLAARWHESVRNLYGMLQNSAPEELRRAILICRVLISRNWTSPETAELSVQFAKQVRGNTWEWLISGKITMGSLTGRYLAVILFWYPDTRRQSTRSEKPYRAHVRARTHARTP